MHFSCLEFHMIEELLLSRLRSDDIDVLINATEALDTIPSVRQNLSVKLYTVKFFFDAPIARFQELQRWLGTNSNIMEGDDFEKESQKIN